METKQMTIDDYLNKGEVEMIDCSTTPVKEKTENVTATKINYIELNKDELIRLLIQKDTTLENYEHKINEMETNHKTEIDNMNDFYRARLNEHTHLIQYYERKLKVLKDIITIEEGGDK